MQGNYRGRTILNLLRRHYISPTFIVTNESRTNVNDTSREDRINDNKRRADARRRRGSREERRSGGEKKSKIQAEKRPIYRVFRNLAAYIKPRINNRGYIYKYIFLLF